MGEKSEKSATGWARRPPSVGREAPAASPSHAHAGGTGGDERARLVPASSLHEDPANARAHGERNRAAVRASLAEFGQVEPLVVEAGTGRVLGGNCRLGELRALGVEEVLVVEVDVHGVDATRLALALNRSAELAEWDEEALSSLLRELDSESVDLASLGWAEEEFAALLDPPKAVDWNGLLPPVGDSAARAPNVAIGDVLFSVGEEVLKQATALAKGAKQRCENDDDAVRALLAQRHDEEHNDES